MQGKRRRKAKNHCNYLTYYHQVDSVFVLVHGAGQTSLVWALLVSEMKKWGYCCVAYDARGHGLSSHANETALSLEQQAEDCAHVIQQVFSGRLKKVCLVGHSMGGAAVVAAAARPELAGIVAAFAVLDVVEGTAMASIPAIAKYINSRPAVFSSPAQAVRWAVDSATCRSEESARLSIPSQLICTAEGDYRWRTPLLETKEYWSGWYSDMSQRFLSCTVPKMLVLAGVDRLDTPLMVGQMQGKYQLVILPQCGHQLQEEAPKELAQKLDHFAKRTL
jgi:pimeloyl-ACP methyl ester carboxylesterase